MNLTSKTTVKSLLAKYNIRPSKRLGQNFLVDKSVLRKITQAADLECRNVVLEIGPGIGTLTWELAHQTKRVITVEKDTKMIEILKETLRDYRNIKIIHADALKIDLKNYKLQTINYKLIANLPYNIASAVIRKFLEAKNPPQEMVLMIQKEVAQRICAKPPRMNLLAVSVQFYVHPVRNEVSNGARPKIISYVSKKSFWPSPKVDSAIIKIVPCPAAAGQGEDRFRDKFFKIVKAGFSQPRKQLINNLTRLRQSQSRREKEKIKTWLLKNKIQPFQRAETLTIKDWINLTKTFQ